jgi:hypothetical protein
MHALEMHLPEEKLPNANDETSSNLIQIFTSGSRSFELVQKNHSSTTK